MYVHSRVNIAKDGERSRRNKTQVPQVLAVQSAAGEFIISSPPAFSVMTFLRHVARPGAPMPTYNTRITCREISPGSHVAGISSNFHPSREKTQHARGAPFASPPLSLPVLLHVPVASRINASPRDIAGILLLLVPLHSVHRLCPLTFVSLRSGVHGQGH